MNLEKAPLFRLIIPFILGIVFQIKVAPQFPYIFECLLGLIVLYILFNLIGKIRMHYSMSWVHGIIIYSCIFLSGMEVTALQEISGKENVIAENEGFIIAKVTEEPVEKEKSIKSVLEVMAIRTGTIWKNASGKTIVFFEKDSLAGQLRMGDEILFEPSFSEIDGPSNPNQFDYRNYLAYHFIYQQTYLKSSKWRILSTDGGNIIQKTALNVRDYFLATMEKYGLKDNEFAVVSALTLGYKNKLDEDIKRSYSTSGAMHVLAVSGLHVGIIYVIINYVLFFLNRNKWGKLVKAILIIAFLWFFAFITGLSPSVMRATTMFSFVIIGSSMNRSASIYNSLAASAFLLLLINPYVIMEVGFQLSYLAVLGIVTFQPGIYSLVKFQYTIPDKIWGLITVSLAAQIITAPIGLLYFHQFPNYFLLTNIIVIPVVTVIVYLAILLFIFSPIPLIAEYIGQGLIWVTKFLNISVEWIEHLPSSLSEGISLDVSQTIILYAFILAITLFFVLRKSYLLHVSLAFLAGFFLIVAGNRLGYKEQRKVVVYNMKGTAAYNFIDGTDNIFFTDLNLLENKNQINFNVSANWLDLGLENEKLIPLKNLKSNMMLSNLIQIDNQRLFCKNGFFDFYGTKFFVINKDFPDPVDDSGKITVDYIILSGNTNVDIKKLVAHIQFDTLIIDSSNSKWKKEKWKKLCAELQLSCHVVEDEGAFVLNL